MKFPTQYDERDRVYVESGDPWRIDYDLQVDKRTGETILKPIGKTNLQEYIDSFKESTDIHNIIAAYQNGDVSALNAHASFYADISEIPKSFIEMFALVKNGENAFAHLPLEVREKFDFDPAKFFASIGTEEFANVMASIRSSNDDSFDSASVEKVVEKVEVDNE